MESVENASVIGIRDITPHNDVEIDGAPRDHIETQGILNDSLATNSISNDDLDLDKTTQDNLQTSIHELETNETQRETTVETPALLRDKDDTLDDNGSDMDDGDIETPMTSTSTTEEGACSNKNDKIGGKKESILRCFEQLKDLAELNFNSNLNKDGLLEFRKKKKKKVTCICLKLKRVLRRFKWSLVKVVKRSYSGDPKQRRPSAVFVSEDMLIHCIRETWLHPDEVKTNNFIEKVHYKKFDEVIGTLEGMDLHFCRIMFRNNLLHFAKPVKSPMKVKE